MKPFTLFLLALVPVACKVTKQSREKATIPFYVKDFLQQSNISSSDFIPNDAGSRVLCLKIKEKGLRKIVDFTGYNVKNENELYCSGFIGGEIKWLNNDELIITKTSRTDPGAVVITRPASLDEAKN